MVGFYIFNFSQRFDEAYRRLGPAFATGTLKYVEDLLEGIEQAPAALLRVLNSENFGTQLVHVTG